MHNKKDDFMRKLIVTLMVVACVAFLEAQEAQHTVGEKFGGGIVFYVTPNGQHGLIVEENEFKIDKNNGYTKIYGMLGDINLKTEEAKNYTDWRLPTFQELKLLYNNKKEVGSIGNGIYVADVFYTFNAPSEPSIVTGKYIGISFKDGKTAGQVFIFNELVVRQIRSF
jgi:hypothetical protein